VTAHIIAGTAGHIDHGKTSLIRALTGIDTDRLKEEKERGITIELGFAHLPLPDGTVLGIVDVPGHEKFVRHMVAGAAGIDLVMLVIAADEGIMPQTREHLDICRMLSIGKGLIVLSKKDMVEPDWLELVTEEVRDYVRGTFLEGAPVIPVSSVSGEGIPDLLDHLQRLVREVEARPAWGIFRLPVDRVFTMRGFGTVATGTTFSGKVKVGDLVRVYPGSLETRVRGLQVHNRSVEEAEAGLRTAVNLQGVEKDQVTRGCVIGHPGMLEPSYILDVRLQLLASAPRALPSRARIRFHLGTSEILGRVHLLEGDSLKPGESALAQVRLEEETVALARDRFVIRSYSPAFTIGGGSVIDPRAGKLYARRRLLDGLVVKLRSLEKGSPDEAVLAALLQAGPGGSVPAALSKTLNLETEAVAAALASLVEKGGAVSTGPEAQDPVLHARVVGELAETVRSLLERFHREQPLKPGLSREEIKTKLPKAVSPKIFTFLLERMQRDGILAADGRLVRLSSHRLELEGKLEEHRRRIEEEIRRAGLSVPSPAELAQDLKLTPPSVKDLIEVMVYREILVKISDDIFIHRDHFRGLEEKIREHLARTGELSVPDFKDLTGLSRKYTIPVLEHFDRSGLTLRVGDKRVAKKG
jgi:selenocysteine-specific elongation factor